jgi:hypothetical protein
MHRQGTTRHYLAGLVVLAGLGPSVCAGADKKGAPGALPPVAVKAWRDAGAEVAWMKDVPPRPDGWGFWAPFREKDEPGAVPAFRYHPSRKGELARLPDPGVAFGLDTHCCAMKDQELQELAHLVSLRSLNLGGGLLLSDRGLKEVARLENLQALYLFYTPVTDAGLRELPGLKDLQALDLFSTQVTDAGLRHLTELRKLQALNLGRTRVTDAGLRELARLKSLRWLDLSGTEVTAAGIAALQKDLPRCKIITGRD